MGGNATEGATDLTMADNEKSFRVETRFRVRYAETDQMGVVYYSNYLVWMEIGRVEWCKQQGCSYREMELEDGILLAVAECQCRYLAPARFDDQIVIKTWIERAHSRMVMFAYEMWLACEDKKLATGYTSHIILDRNFSRTRLPEKYFPMFGLNADGRPVR
jgi:acyl-CoA thioester hydrolase